jgi:hypothetical protein
MPRSPLSHTIWLHPEAPAKPAVGAACNGCGVCCALEPCPAGALLSRRLRGACTALRWSETARCYRCGLLSAPDEVLARWPRPLRQWIHRHAGRWIASGQGCDADWTPQDAPSTES